MSGKQIKQTKNIINIKRPEHNNNRHQSMIRVNEPAIGKQNCGNRRSVFITYFDLPGTKTRLWGANSAQRKGAHLHCFYTRLNTLTKNPTPRTFVVNNRVRSEGIRRSLIASAKPHGNIRLYGWIFQAPSPRSTLPNNEQHRPRSNSAIYVGNPNLHGSRDRKANDAT